MRQIKGRFTVPAKVGQVVSIPTKSGTNPFHYKIIKVNSKSVIIENTKYHTKFAVILVEKTNNNIYAPITEKKQ